MLGKLIRSLVEEPRSRRLDLESGEATSVHGELVRSKPFLRKLYGRYYARFEEAGRCAPSGLPRLELGSGGGFLDQVVPDLTRIDVRPGARVDLRASAMDLPLANKSIGAVFMLNVLHHLPDAERFFVELDRTLAPGGRCVMIEPYVSPVSRLIYRHLHHEPFDPDQSGWSFDGAGAMTGANDALPWIIFERDRDRFQRMFPALEVRGPVAHTAVLYLASGGLSYRAALPSAAFGPLSALEDRLGRLLRPVASMMTVELVKK